jgi:peroxiredoxin
MTAPNRLMLPRLLLVSLVWFSGCASAPKNVNSAPDNKVVGDFTLRDLKGHRVSFRDFGDKVVLLSFWATWCGPCHTELPLLEEMWKRHRERGFELVSICVDPADTENEVRQMVRRYRYGFPVLMDQETEVANRFNPTMDLPFSLLIDKHGKIVFVHQGYRIGDEVTVEKKIQELIAR